MMKSGFIYRGFVAPGLGFDVKQMRRNAMRDALAKSGFTWRKTSGVPPGEEWNIDNWPTVSLENIIRAHNTYGWIVADLHNRKKFNPANTANYHNIVQIVEAHEEEYAPPDPGPSQVPSSPSNGSSGGGGNPLITLGGNGNNNSQQQIDQILQYLQSQQSGNGSGSSGTPAWLPLAMIGAGGLALVMVLR